MVSRSKSIATSVSVLVIVVALAVSREGLDLHEGDKGPPSGRR